MNLILFAAQGSPYQWSGVGWVVPKGDEWYILNCGILEVLGGDMATLSSLIANGPEKSTKLFPLTDKEQWHRLHILRVAHLDAKKWEKLCPRPTDAQVAERMEGT